MDRELRGVSTGLLLWLAMLPGVGGAQSLADAGSLGTPCVISRLRPTAQAAAQPPEACLHPLQLPVQEGVLDVGWLTSIASAALDSAERSHCPEEGCISRRRDVRFILFSDRFATASVLSSQDSLDISMSTGMVSFVNATATAILSPPEARAAEGEGLARYFERLNTASERSCEAAKAFVPLPGSEGGLPTSPQAREGAKAIMTFLLAHEFAHEARGEDCGSGSTDALVKEQACDRLAFNQLSFELTMPALVVLWLVGMHHYEQLFSTQLLSSEGATGRAYAQVFPARDWTARAKSLIQEWREKCGGGAQLGLCGSNWKTAAKIAEVFSDIPPPAPCTEIGDSPPAVQQNDPAASQCLQLLEEHELPNWNELGSPPLVSLNKPYKNNCLRPISCSLTFSSGTTPRKGPRAWEPFMSVEKPLSLAPGETRNVTALLRWLATAERMPSLRVPGKRRPDLVRCQFTGPAVQATRGDSPVCQAVLALIEAAELQFQPIQGEAEPSGVNSKPEAWKSQVRIPPAEECTIWPADTSTPARLSCRVFETTEPSALDAEYETWAQNIAECLEPSLWSRTESTYTSYYLAERRTDFVRAEGVSELRVSRVQWLDGLAFGVDVDFTAPALKDDELPPPHPGPSRKKLVADNVEAAMDLIFQLIAQPEELVASEVSIRRERGKPSDEQDQCAARPKFHPRKRGCHVEWTCWTRQYFRSRERRERFGSLVSRYVQRLKSDPSWRSTREDGSDWSAYIEGKQWSWSARTDSSRFLLRIQTGFGSMDNIAVSLSAVYLEDAPWCQGEE